MFLALTVVCSFSAIHASEVNITDSNLAVITDDKSNPLDRQTLLSDSESDNSNFLSTDSRETSQNTGKNQTELTSQKDTIYYKGSYNVNLKDSNANVSLANKSVNFVINNVNYTATTNNEGVAGINLTLNPGKYSLTAFFEGDDAYEASNNITSMLEILPTIKASDITKYYKAGTQYSATFFDSQGNALANRYVTVTVNGKTYTKKTNGNGGVSLPVNLKPGTYKVVSKDSVTGYEVTTSFKILSTVSASNVKKVVGDSKKFTAKFLKSNGKALSKKYIKFKFKGKTYKVKTNSKGQASFSLKNLKKGTYKIVCLNRDGLSKTYTIKAYYKVSTKFSTSDYTFFKSQRKTVKATLSNSFGYAPTSGKVVKITINGKTYTKKTNGKGVVSLKLPSLKKGIYTVKYKFRGAAHYKSCSASGLVTVITTSNSDLTVKSTTTFGYGAGTAFKVAATAGGVALAKRTVTFKVDGKTYAGTTNNNGIASLPINLEIGNYTIDYSINKESKVNAKSASANIAVKERMESQLTWKSGTSFSDSSQTIKVLLRDLNGNPISGQTLKLTVKSKTYTATTSSNGYATFKAYAPVGTYTVSVRFAGNNEYLPNSTSNTVTVTISNLKKGVNEKNTVKDLSAYLKSSSHCQVGNSKIKSLVNSLTKGLTSDFDKAEAIFNYVRDKVSYSFYYNTHYGAAGTLSAKRGNCVDQSHLLVAMYRTAGLAARYVHGKCTFSSGNTYGHVWAQVLIGNTWVCADATSSRNSFGEIVNWNTKSFTLNSRYSSLPF